MGGRVASKMMVSGEWRRVASQVGVTRGFMGIRLSRVWVRRCGDQMRSPFGRCPHLRIEIWGHPASDRFNQLGIVFASV
jgi:hypothetical protein